MMCFVLISRRHRIVVKGNTVDDGNEEQGPVSSAFCDRHRVVVVYGEEDVCDICEIG